MTAREEWRLRRVVDADEPALYDLLCLPPVYRYLADGEPPSRPVLSQWMAAHRRDRAASALGLWVLRSDKAAAAGLVRLEGREESRSAELTYVLHPGYWGRGLATRMSWTVIRRAFESGTVDEIVAGTDQPNRASLAVMRRLGMRFLRHVEYPANPGLEYVLERGDPGPERVPIPIERDEQ